MELKINRLPLAFMKCSYEKAAKYIIYSLLFISFVSLLFALTVSYVYAIKVVLIIATAVFVTRETEILFLTHDKKIARSEAKEIIKQTYPIITGLIYALLLPIGTPLYVVAVGAFVAIFVGKMIFGGFSYNPFNPAIIGILFVSLSWPLVLTNNLNEGLVNYLLSTLTDTTSFSQYYDMKIIFVGFNQFYVNIGDIGFPFFCLIGALLMIMRIINPINVIVPMLTFFIAIFSVTKDIEYTTTMLVTNSMLFCLIYLANDPFTTPLSNYGKVIYGVIIGLTSAVMIYLGSVFTGIVYAILFANLFVPLINSLTIKTKFKDINKVIKLVVISLIVIATTVVTINVAASQTEETSEVGERL